MRNKHDLTPLAGENPELILLTASDQVKSEVGSQAKTSTTITTDPNEVLELLGSQPFIVIGDSTSLELPVQKLLKEAVHASEPCYALLITDSPLNIPHPLNEFADILSIHNLSQATNVIDRLSARIIYEQRTAKFFTKSQQSAQTNQEPENGHQSNELHAYKEETATIIESFTHYDYVPLFMRIAATPNVPIEEHILQRCCPEDQAISETIVQAIAEIQGVDPVELDPLFSAIDSEAVDSLFAQKYRGQVEFTYEGYDISVKFDEEPVVTIHES